MNVSVPASHPVAWSAWRKDARPRVVVRIIATYWIDCRAEAARVFGCEPSQVHVELEPEYSETDSGTLQPVENGPA